MGFEVERGVRRRAQRVVIYGQHGIGKTTLAARFPRPVFIDTENGTDELDVARLPRPDDWATLCAEVAWAATQDEFATIVIDSADWAEALCTAYVCMSRGWADVEAPGYGKGYVAVRDEFSKMLSTLTWAAWSRGKNVVLVAHDQVSTVTRPDDMTGYSVWGLKLGKHVAALVKEWADAVLYCRYRVAVVRDQGGRGHAVGGDERVMQCTHTATVDAKNRWGIEGEMPMAWETIAQHVPDMAVGANGE